MKANPFHLIIACLLAGFFTTAQVQKPSVGEDFRYRLQLQNGSFTPQKNITADQIGRMNRKAIQVNKLSLVIIQFETIPTTEQRKELQRSGIELLGFIPPNAYTATIKDSLSAAVLNKVKARAVIVPGPEQKMPPELLKGVFPAHAVKVAGTVDLVIGFPRTFSYETVSKELKARNVDIISTTWQNYRVVGIRIADNRLKELASLPFIEYMDAIEKEEMPLNNKSTVNARANILQSSLPGGRNLQGEGVVVGIGDDAEALSHIDFSGRLINRADTFARAHGIHVTGIVGGAGIVDERFKGFAPKATIVSQKLSAILANASAYVADYGMVITNNSYGNENTCPSFGVYNLFSRIMDQQAFELPNLQHVFAAGNSGTTTCSPYSTGFGNVFGAYQSAKNVITVGNTRELGAIFVASSKGPVRDGRIKPEIVAQGTIVRSTFPNNGYTNNTGTSMSSPAVAGGLALLYQRYRQLNSGTNPKSGLMKVLLCNGATDLGNAGPDYTYGFGWMNLLRSVTMLEKNNYFHDSVNAGSTKTHTITIPAGSSIAQLKVMLYWNDSAAAVLASQTLVNDLDLEVADPSAAIHFPQKLDTVRSQVHNAATTGVDHINNIEQVVIDNPTAGVYTFSVKGTTIPFAPDYEYFLVYDTIPVSAKLSFPIGGERLQQGDSIYISWDAYGNPSNDFTLQYSTNNGSTWTTINSSVADTLRLLKWFIPTIIADPTIVTDQARIKLIHNGTGIESMSEAFTIIGVPVLTAGQCDGYITLSWAAITGATDYEVMMVKDNEMVAVGTTTGTAYNISGLSSDSIYWVAVRARLNGNPGRRCVAVSLQPNGAACGGSISDNDLKIDAIISPASSGRILTSTELSNNVSITIRIKNLDNAATAGDIPVAYKIGAGPQVNDLIIAPNIAAGATYTHIFPLPEDLSAVGTYPLQVSVSYPGDIVTANDTLVKIFKQLDNAFIDLNASPFLDDIESATVQSHTTAQIGLEGLDRYDFLTTTAFGRIRSFINSGIAYSGSKALTLDTYTFNGIATADSLKATFNLQGFNVNTDDVRFDFLYKQHNQEADAASKVWIRGDDQAPWIEVYDLFANQGQLGVFKKSQSIEVSDILAANSQVFTSSFQARWGQRGVRTATDDFGGDGYTFDDIHLYLVTDDIQLVGIDTPVVSNCALTNTTAVRVSVRNASSGAISNIPVTFRVNGNTPVTESIGLIPGNTTISYTFTATADLSAIGNHTLETWVSLGSDTFRGNDTASLDLVNAPLITVFPYLQNFEAGDGSWYSSGVENSWQYGTPASSKINRAASGSKAWKTNLAGNHNDQELSYLYSPCFDIAGMTNPTLSVNIALDLEDCGAGTLCDAAYVEYSADGQTWIKLGATGAGTNWYNRNYAGHHVWSVENYTRWHVATIPLPTSGLSRLRLRFVMQTDPFVNFEGIAIDDIHIYDNIYGIYTGAPASAVVNQATVNGTNWIDFTDGGRLVASINPNGQNLGSTDVQAHIHTGAIRVNSGQYIHNRNITIKPSTVSLADSATVRFYFLDSETEALINATGCGLCSKPAMVCELGVTKYSNSNDALENGSLTDNGPGGTNWLFINPTNAIKVPFGAGYYTEFKVKDFSEFWLNNGGPNNNLTLPVDLISFNATKQPNDDVSVEWITASETNTIKYEVELAKGNGEFTQNRFVKIGERISNGNTTTEQHYQFTDTENNKAGARYYRLKIIDQDGGFSYSQIRVVVFHQEIRWEVYPNPSSGTFNLAYQVNAGENVSLKIYDINGKEVKQIRFTANGFVQKQEIDLRGNRFNTGMYLLEVISGDEKRVFRIVKQ